MTSAHSCNHCGNWVAADAAHDCPESHPNPDLVARLREDHRDTTECEHGFSLFNASTCPNVVCLGRDLREAADEIVRLRGIVAALRDPTETMIDAGGDRAQLGWDPAPQAVWRAMFDAAIQP